MEIIKKIFNKIKQAIHNKFFQEVYCSNCGRKDKIMHFKKLKDNSLLCKDCISELAIELSDNVSSRTLQDFKNALSYTERSQNEFEPIFKNNAGFHSFKVDAVNKLFKVDSDANELIFELSNIAYYNFEFKGEEIKEGVFKHKIIGDVHLTLQTVNPRVKYETVVATELKVKSSSVLFNTVLHGNPEELDSFLENFDMLCETAKAEKNQVGQ